MTDGVIGMLECKMTTNLTQWFVLWGEWWVIKLLLTWRGRSSQLLYAWHNQWFIKFPYIYSYIKSVRGASACEANNPTAVYEIYTVNSSGFFRICKHQYKTLVYCDDDSHEIETKIKDLTKEYLVRCKMGIHFSLRTRHLAGMLNGQMCQVQVAVPLNPE